MSVFVLYILSLIISFGIVLVVHPYLVRFALWKDIVDKPNARRLNRVPVPVLGGVGVFLGFVASLYSVAAIMGVQLPNMYIVVLILMLGVGIVDDVRDLNPYAKFAVQILAVLLLYFFAGMRIDNLYGLLGLYELPMCISLPLTLVACVGLINSINLIDGIDGLSSGYCIVASFLFGLWGAVAGDCVNVLISLSMVGSLIPFFIYNVFGKKNKMFIGDSGSHLLGVILCIQMLNAVNRPLADSHAGFAVVPFVLAVLSHPVLDTLRVMIMRLSKGVSPFKADKTHLHHALVGKGVSHLLTTMAIVGANLLVVVIWFASGLLGFSPVCQLLVVVVMAMFCIVVPYPLLVRNVKR